MIRRRLLPVACLAFALSTVVAWAQTLKVVGTGDGLELFKQLGALYEAQNPQAKVEVPPSIGSGGAIAAVGAGSERIGRIARNLSSVEVASGLVSIPVFDIPSAFYVHPGVGARALSAKQLREIFEGKITNWQSVGGPDLRIRVVRREENDSTLLVLRAALPEFQNLDITDRSKLALTTQEAMGSIRDNDGAIGFGPFAVANLNDLAVISLNGHAPTSDGYPAKVRVSVLLRENNRDPDIQAFLRFLNSAEARNLMVAAGALPVGK